MFVFKLALLLDDDVSEFLSASHVHDLPKFFNGVTMTLDERNGDIECDEVASDTLDGARRVPCFGESVADVLAEFFVFGKVDVVAPSDAVGVDEKILEFDFIWIFNPYSRIIWISLRSFVTIDAREQHRAERAM